MTAWQVRVTGVADAIEEMDTGATTYTEGCQKIADILKDQCADVEYVEKIIDDFECVFDDADQDEINYILGCLYDWADDLKVWIEPTTTKEAA